MSADNKEKDTEVVPEAERAADGFIYRHVIKGGG